MGTSTSRNFLDGIVACPQENISWAGNLSSVALSGDSRRHGHSMHIQELLSALSDSDGVSGGAPIDTPFAFASTTILYGMLTLETIVFVCIISWRYHGLRLLVARDAGTISRERRVTPPTDNSHWKLYFLSNALGHLLTILILQVPAIHNSAEAMRILELLQRFLLGGNCLALAFALNHQRIHRVKEHRKQVKVSPELIRQVSMVNRACTGVFMVFCVTDFVSNHIVDALSDVASYFYWGYVAMLGVLNVPVVLAVLWIGCHEAPIQASRFSKGALTIATAIHLIVVLPPTFWSQYAFHLDTSGPVVMLEGSDDPADVCPFAGGRMSRFDVLVAVNIISLAIYFAFVVLEHRRNRLIGQTDHYHATSDVLEEGPARHKRQDLVHVNSNPASSKGSELSTLLNEDEDFGAIVEVPVD